MTPLEQAKELRKRIQQAMDALRGNDNFYEKFADKITESEVKFRFESVKGMLQMADNDTRELVLAFLAFTKYEERKHESQEPL